jgi:endoglycosylceramidase
MPMVNRWAGAALAAVLVTVVPAAPAAGRPHAGPGAAVPAAAAPASPIGHAGRWITDSTGRVLVVSGVNMVYKLPPYAPDAAGFGDDDAAFLAANGFSAVRLGVIWKALEPQPGVFDDAYLARIAASVRVLGRHGIVSLLDFHQDMYNEKFQGEGAPDWAVDDNGLPAAPALGFPANYFFQPALRAAYDNFWANTPVHGTGLQDWYAGAWDHVAAYFRGSPDLLGYDIFNEPFPGSRIYRCLVPAGCMAADAILTRFDRKITAAIRRADPETMIFTEPWITFSEGYPTSAGATGDPHAGFSFHDYCPFTAIAAQLNVACPPFSNATFANAERHSTRTGDALLLTEFGATSDPGVLSSAVSAAEKHRIGWLVWAYCGCGDPTTSGSPSSEGIVSDPVRPPTGSNVNEAMLAALAVPHPELVAGTPVSYGYDTSTHTFTLGYTTRRADGAGAFPAGSRTTVAVPPLQYPQGYRVTVNGARVLSAGSILRLASCPGATDVTLTVSRGAGVRSSC